MKLLKDSESLQKYQYKKRKTDQKTQTQEFFLKQT
jgi:hypothetical protein